MGSKPTEKIDYFGRPIKERFPYYPYGVIIPGCKTGSCSRHRMTSKCSKNPAQKTPCIPTPVTSSKQTQDKSKILQQSTATTTIKTNVKKDEAPGGPSFSSHTKQNPINSAEACRKIAMLVAEQLPQCNSEEFLQEIEQKCRNYWDALGRHSIYLDENEVCKQLTQKLQAWDQGNDCCDYHRDLRLSSSSCENVSPTTDKEEEEESTSRQVVNGEDDDDYYDELGEYEDEDDDTEENNHFLNQQLRIKIRGLP